MFKNSLYRALIAVVPALAVASIETPIYAEQPEPVKRTFGVLGSGGSEEDFVSDDSIALTVLPDFENIGRSLEFGELTDPDDVYDNTVWVANAAHHSVVGGKPAGGTYFWLITDDTPTAPPIGAHTFTGPDSPLILSQEVVYISTCNGTCGPFNDDKWRWAASGGIPFVIVTAVFSK